MTEHEKLMLDAIILNDGHCHLHIYRCNHCPIRKKCFKEHTDGRYEAAMEMLANLELEDMLREKV
jgi:hypothetical protein